MRRACFGSMLEVTLSTGKKRRSRQENGPDYLSRVTEIMVDEGNESDVFQALMDVIEQRRTAPSDKSYTSQLFSGGVSKIGGKILEESREFVEAADESGAEARQHQVHEAADLLYHLFVMLAHCGLELDDIRGELARRFGMSGLEEKASRPDKK